MEAFSDSEDFIIDEEIFDDEEQINYYLRENFALDDYQQAAVDLILERILKTQYKVQLLPAMTGWGKTFAALATAMHLWDKCKIRPLIVCPATLNPMWKKAFRDLEIPIWDIISYNSLSGQKGKLLRGVKGTPSELRAEANLKHGLLVRENGDLGPFFATEKWGQMVNKGVLLICDEPQALKNSTSAVHYAAHALISEGLSIENGKFACLHLSAAMLDGDKLPFFRSMGIMLKKDAFFNNPGLGLLEWENYGFGDVYELACEINKIKTHSIMKKHVGFDTHGNKLDRIFRLRKDRFEALLHELWIEIFRDYCAIPVVDPIYADENGVPFKNELINGFYELCDEDAEKCEAAIKKLKTAGILKDDGQVNTKAQDAIKAIQAALVQLCDAKKSGVLKQTLKDLREDKTCKVILSIPYLDAQDYLLQKLKIYNPLCLRGSVRDVEERHRIIAKFNDPSLQHRVMIMTPGVGGVGVSLHDHIEPSMSQMKNLPMFKTPKEAIFPRKTYMIFNYHFLLMFQNAGRAYRRGMRSDNKVVCFYASNAPLESVLINTMMKSGNADSIAPPGTGRKFPDQYDIYIENEGPQHKPLRDMMLKMREMSSEQIKKNKRNM